MTKQTFIQKHGGYIIDYAFCILSILAVVQYYRVDGNYTTGFAIVALYAFVVTRRLKYQRNQYLAAMDKRDKEIKTLLYPNTDPTKK